MAFGDGVSGTWSIEDTKGQVSSATINFPANVDVPLVTGDFMRTTAQLIDEIIDGKIVGASASINVNLGGANLKDAPIVGSDVEEGATFSFGSTAGAPTSFRIPTFDEALGLQTGTGVDTSISDVEDLILRILNGDTQGLTTVRFADSHGNNVANFKGAKENFRKSRKGS